MNCERIRLLLTAVTVCISLTVLITPTYGSSIVIGGDTTDIGTIIFVSPKSGDSPTTAGTALLNTINGIADNSATNPYLIKLGPGIYDIGTSSVQIKEYVDIEGSGENTSVITGNIDSFGQGVVQGANYAEIRFLTVRNTGEGTYAVAISNSSSSPKITNVTASASGAANYNYAVFNYSSSSPTMTNVTVSASGGTNNYGVCSHPSSPTSTNSPTMTNVTVSVSGGTDFNCGVYNISSSPTMTNVTVSASGSGATSTSIAIFNGNSAVPRITNTKVSSSGVGYTTGIGNSSSSPIMTNVEIIGIMLYGVHNEASSPAMTNLRVSASASFGVYSEGAGSVRINHSVIHGFTNTIVNNGGITYVGNTQLDGGSVSNIAGTVTCAGVYDENYTFYPSTCP
jgi:hypothetical protein